VPDAVGRSQPGASAPVSYGTIPAMTSIRWSAFEQARPDLAAAGRDLMYQFGVGLAFLSTVRPDGGPRLHPFCPLIIEGRLVAHIIPSRKRDDLDRDPRYALHSFATTDNEDAFYLTGEARRVDDDALTRRAAAQFFAERKYESEPEAFAAGRFYEFFIGRCLLTRTTGRDDWDPQHTVWAAAG
jgi:hypothetical protein